MSQTNILFDILKQEIIHLGITKEDFEKCDSSWGNHASQKLKSSKTKLLSSPVVSDLKNMAAKKKNQSPKPKANSKSPWTRRLRTQQSVKKLKTESHLVMEVIPKVSKGIFGAELSSLPMTQTSLHDGIIVSVPQFIKDATDIIKKNISLEGLFRKAGSIQRQNNIKKLLEQGGSLPTDAHPIDCACLLKQFFRSLPNRLFPTNIYSLLVRCMDLPLNSMEPCILRSLLLLPKYHQDTAAFLFELLLAVASFSQDNLMDSNNLAIVMAPNLFPNTSDIINQVTEDARLCLNISIVEMLIKLAPKISRVPSVLEEMLACKENQINSPNVILPQPSPSQKKKRRSASLKRMINGLYRAVQGNNVQGSTTPLQSKVPEALRKMETRFQPIGDFTPKRTYIAPDCTPKRSFTAPHRIAMYQDSKRARDKDTDEENKIEELSPTKKVCLKSNVVVSPKRRSPRFATPQLSRPVCSKATVQRHYSLMEKSKPNSHNVQRKRKSISSISRTPDLTSTISTEATVQPIESPLFKEDCHEQEFPLVKAICNAYEQVKKDCENLDTSPHEDLTRRLGRELKRRSRRSGEHRVSRSPSERKIGVIRRRSKETSHKSNGSIIKSPLLKTPQSAIRRNRPITPRSTGPNLTPNRWECAKKVLNTVPSPQLAHHRLSIAVLKEQKKVTTNVKLFNVNEKYTKTPVKVTTSLPVIEKGRFKSNPMTPRRSPRLLKNINNTPSGFTPLPSKYALSKDTPPKLPPRKLKIPS